MKHYTHLSQDERYQIYSMKSHGISISQMAIHLDRSESTLRREIKRGSGKKGYRPKQAQQLSELRSLGSRNGPVIAPSVWLQVDQLTRQDYSPEQIAAKLKASTESIYQHIYRDPTGELKTHLRCQKKRKKRYASGRSKRGQIANRRSINTRPASVENRHQVGHWEADTIIGKNHQGAIVSLIERKSGLAKLKLVANKSAHLVSNAIIEMLQSVPQAVISITSDNGKEFAMHQEVDAALGCTSYFADPYCSWQRGSNENANGLVRQYVPKKRLMGTVTDQEVQMIEDKLNARPRKRHDFKSPEDIFYTSIYRRALRA